MDDEPNSTRGKIHVLTRQECLTLLTSTTVGRIAFVDEQGSQIVPVNFALIDDAIYFRTLPDGYLSTLRSGTHRVAFGVDHHDDLFRDGWNVTVRGPIRQVEDRATINKILGHRQLHPWAGGVRPMVMKIAMESVEGRRVSGH